MTLQDWADLFVFFVKLGVEWLVIFTAAQDDLERVGGNFDLVVNYEYGPCGRCFGSGCAKCDRLGVVRTKRGVAA